jgi:cell division transport system ATP-binding protein
MIRFNQVSKRYPNGQLALYQVDFCLDTGEMAFLTGHSGAGKSTLLKLIALLERPSVGDLLIDNRNVNHLSRNSIPDMRQRIGLIFQDPHLLFNRNVFENVVLPLDIAGFSRKDSARRVRAALDKVGLLAKEMERPETLSSGEQQRVNIARAIVNKPSIILADEPTGNLDPDLSRDIMHLFEQFHQTGVTVLIASHDIQLISQLSYRRLVLDKGRLI